jgi:hypothetical protein
MDNEFIKERAAHCRFLAEKADPFIKRRLLDLAAKYEADFSKQPSQISIGTDRAASDTSQSVTRGV